MKKITSAFFLLFALFAYLALTSCSVECDHKRQSSIVIPPTCQEEGYTLNTCIECKAEFKTDHKLPTGHTLRSTALSPTCELEGYTYYTCHCGYNYTSDAIPPLGHIYIDTIIPASCESAGYTEHICYVCKHIYKTDFVDADGHIINKEVIHPTEYSVGYTEYSCSVCDLSYKDDLILYSDIYGGGSLPSTTVKAMGIDVSKWQNAKESGGPYVALDWTAIKASGVEFAILRAGNTGSKTGDINKDPAFEMNYHDAKAAGVMVGAYYYSVATTEEKLDKEIDALLGWLEGKQFEYPIYIDIEDSALLPMGKDALTSLCMRFVRQMREKGYFGAVYTNQSWLDEHLNRAALTEFCDIWFAHYVTPQHETADGIYVWNELLFGSPLSMWQYTDDGVIEGSNIQTSSVDMNYCYKDYPAIIKTYGLNGFAVGIE